ncbi:SGNH hydrolase [Massarina eburnea CBS 473.64]|uniref:SGNH hydrolase n=1 Tax=Massarina eburnea CBS 473.64 TaxID=1395130 RepID=A0A6A6RKN6_9PLEO|nr:SGNH hydrolase [Massarina eburnea CBS 473.64]
MLSLLAFLTTLSFSSFASTSPTLAKTPAFILAGDSTTAVQSTGGGGWGTGFLATLIDPSYGVNKGHNGATTVSFVDGGDWAAVKKLVSGATASYEVYVTIQFGHNDQKSEKNISISEFKTNLKALAQDVKDLGATPLILTSLTRRKFDGTELKDDLSDVVPAARTAAADSNVALIDLNAASRKYVQAIGSENADKYNLVSGDRTHLNAHGSDVFGRIVADLILAYNGNLSSWIEKNATLSGLIADGVYA